jgi:drug/metabolite transporter (DMT)-like permease
MEAWILFTFLAAFMQAIRTAGQKKLATSISPMTTTLVRYLFGLPFAIVYLLLIADTSLSGIATSLNQSTFLTYASFASVAQIVATVFLVKTLRLRNFAVGTCFAKTEAIQTALLGVVFFTALLSWQAWLAVLIGTIGILILTLPSKGQQIDGRSVLYGLVSGLTFAMTSLWLRQASLSLPYSYVENAAITLVYMVTLQSILCLVYVGFKEAQQLSLMLNRWRLCTFVGASSAFGSVGWFTAMTYENAALVKSLGQVEIVFTLLITYFTFNEKVSRKEYLGILAIISSVLILLKYT